MEKYQGKYRRETIPLRGYDYGADGKYFITICTESRIHYFGKIALENQETLLKNLSWPIPFLHKTEIGKIAYEYWSQIPDHFPFVQLDEFAIMPDHVHGILIFNKPEKTDWGPNKFGPQSQNLGSVIRGFKASVKRYANDNNIPFEWQSKYYDRIIRDNNEFIRIKKYIENNPTKWYNDNCGK